MITLGAKIIKMLGACSEEKLTHRVCMGQVMTTGRLTGNDHKFNQLYYLSYTFSFDFKIG